ncbi:MAG: cysteine--tRNA ligase [Actinomycetota bacterium]|nr:cysteine--tRNA ligase [Actinomycetota bacterium]MDQ3574943.1 cysteine--tRNA ligase [Actinomycetota bacterium]
MLRLHDTALGEVVELDLREPGRVSMYVCGPTVYDDPHLGHGRFALVWDVVRRYLEWSGLSVRFVSNVTDLDDKIIDRARREGRTAEEVAGQYEKVWYEALDALGVRRPDEDPHATDYVERMVVLVKELVGRGVAYQTADGVYFSVDHVGDYGLLARQSLESLQAGARVEVGEEKRSALDFVLWKKAKPGEPEWPSPWGPGRPGWHTECVVMALDLLGEGFDLHGAGIDLAFPHHENERAQAEALGRPFARRWAHSGFVLGPGGVKMSKSLANFTSLTDLLARTDGRAYRLLVLQSHYRAPLEVGPQSIERAERSLERLDELARRVSWTATSPDAAILAEFRDHMDDDLGTPGATALLFDLVGRANAALDAGDTGAGASMAATAAEMAGSLGLELRADVDEIDEETAGLMAERDAARAAKDYARSDALRDELVTRGWAVKDTPGGTTVHRRRPGSFG